MIGTSGPRCALRTRRNLLRLPAAWLDRADDGGVRVTAGPQRGEAVMGLQFGHARQQSAGRLRIEDQWQTWIVGQRPRPRGWLGASRTFCGCSELKMPRRTVSSAPSSNGNARATVRHRPPDGRTISTRWPIKPKPVTSVQAVAPWSCRQRAAARLDSSIEASAASIHRPLALPRMSAANNVPVPSGLVRISLSPGSHATLAQQARRVGQAVDGEAHGEFGALAGMAADQRRIGLVQHLQCAGHELLQQVLHFGFEAERDADDRQRRLRLAAHGEDVAQAVVGGDLAEHIRIVDQCRGRNPQCAA